MPYVVSGYWTAGYAEGDQINMDVSWVVFDVLAASLTLTQSSRYDNTPDTFYSPTLTFNLSQSSILTNTNVFNNHSISTVVSVTQNTRYDNTPDTFYSPTVTVGPVTVTQSSLYNNTDSFFSPTITTGPVTVTQNAIFNNTNSFFSIMLGTLLLPNRLDSNNIFYSPTTTVGPVTLTQSSLYNNTDTFFSPTIGLNITQNTRYDNTPDIFYSPTVTVGPVTLTQSSLYTNTDTFFSPTISLTLTQSTRYNNTPDTFYSPTVTVIIDISSTGTTSTQVNSTGIAQPIYTTDTVQVNSTTVNTISKNTKLGILYKNIGDLATLSSTSTAISGFPLINLQSEHKYKLWRVSGNTASFSMTWTTGQTISAIIFPISNLNSSAIIRVRTYADEAGTAIISDTGNQQPILSTQESVGINNYSHYSNSIARVFVSKVSNIKHCKIDITDTTPQGYIEISRLVCGEIWNPTYGTSYGLSSVFLSDSKHERTEAGNIYTDRKNTYKSISFDLNYLTLEDRQNLLKLINTSGTRNPLFISIFPNSEDPIKEETYQIYGKIVDSPVLNNPMYSMYSTNLTLESV